MRYSKLGSSGLVVSKLAFGALTLGIGTRKLEGFSGLAGEDASRIVDAALDSGINIFDVADEYQDGESEVILGKALAKRRQDVVISTKGGWRTGECLTQAGLSARHIHASIDNSLRRLGTDWIDVYTCHKMDPYTPLEETLLALDQIVRSGKVRYIGFSNWPAWLAAKAVALQQTNGWARFVSGQMYYSVACRDIEHEYVPMALDAGIGTMVWSPLAGGFLSGKYTREDPDGQGGRLGLAHYSVYFDREHGYNVVDILREIGNARNVSVAAIALAWLLGKPTVSTAIFGVTRQSQLADNLVGADLELSAEEYGAIERVATSLSPYPQNFLSEWDDLAVRAALGATRS